MEHERAALTLIDIGAMTPSLGAMGMGHLRRKSYGGVGLHVADVIDRHWQQKAAMDHEWAGLTAIGGWEVDCLKRRDDSILATGHKTSSANDHRSRGTNSERNQLAPSDSQHGGGGSFKRNVLHSRRTAQLSAVPGR